MKNKPISHSEQNSVMKSAKYHRVKAMKSSHITLIGNDAQAPYVCKSPENMTTRNLSSNYNSACK